MIRFQAGEVPLCMNIKIYHVQVMIWLFFCTYENHKWCKVVVQEKAIEISRKFCNSRVVR